MNEFENKLIISVAEYKNGLFPQIPNLKKRGSAFILTNGLYDDIKVDEHTTAKEIRQGKYSQLVEISTLPYTKELRFNSQSKEIAYSFDVYVKAVIQVYNPITFYENRNLDVDSYFDNLFSLDVRKITQKYSILDYTGMDDELTQKLSSYNSIDDTIGFSYRISVVDAVPGTKAQEYVEKYGKQQLDASLREKTKEFAKSLTTVYEEAIMEDVIDGKLSQSEAILKIEEYKQLSYDNQMKCLEELREKGFITNSEVRDYVVPVLEKIKIEKGLPQKSAMDEWDETDKNNIDLFYTEENE